jgi:DNA-binding transcriptional LysR family regulator
MLMIPSQQSSMASLLSFELSIPPFAMNDAMFFVSTVGLGSFTAAAERHDITASGVSRAITRLERSLGVRLLVRTTRSLRPTEEGELFFEHCREAVRLMATAAEQASNSSASLKGLLRVGLPSIVGTHVIVPMLPNLLTLHPQLSIQLVRVTTVAEFYSHQVDCALLPGDPMDSALAGRELRGRAVWSSVAAPGYIARYGLPIVPSDLQQHHCITLLEADGQERPWVFRAGEGEPYTMRVRGRIRTDDMEQVMAAAVAGLGIAQVPHLPLRRAIAARQLVVLMPEHEAGDMPLWVVYAARRALPKRLRAFVDFLLAPPLAPGQRGTPPPRLLQ